MPLFIQKIPHFLFGVSQRPNVQKDASQLQVSNNWLARAAYGMAKRPPFVFLGKLTSSLTGVAGASIFSIHRDSTDRYRVVIRDGALNIYDQFSGMAAVTVEDRSNDTYLDDAGADGFRMVTIGDSSFICNRGVEVQQGAGKSASQRAFSLVTVEEADFATDYTITLGATDYTISTVDQGDATSRGQINTTAIAEALFDKITNLFTSFTFDFELHGSTIFIQTKAIFLGMDFKVDTWDGLSDNGLRLIKGTIQDVEDLTLTRAPHGTKVKVLGDAGTEKDDFWMEYDATGTDLAGDTTTGKWRPTVAPGVGIKLDAETMPHRLVFKGSKIEGNRFIVNLPPAPLSGRIFGTTTTGGWDEDQDGGGVTEEDDDIIQANLAGRRMLIPGADGTTKAEATITFDIDTATVDYGKDTIVNLIHRTAGGTETVLERKRFQPGETKTEESFVVEGTWAATDRFKMTLEYGDDAEPASGTEATLTMLGHGKADMLPRYFPTKMRPWGGASVTFPNNFGGALYPAGTQVSVTLSESGDEVFTHAITAGGETPTEVATAMAALIDASGTYGATSVAAQVDIQVSGTLSADPEITSLSTAFVANTAVTTGLTLVLNEFIGETLENITDGSSGTISGNSTDGVFTAPLSGGTDNLYATGDVIRVIGTGGYFVYEPVTWDERTVGDETTNPWPSFIGQTVRDLFFYRNRFGLVAGRGVVMSESGDVLNFFRTSVQALLDGDTIDVESAHGDVAIFHSAVNWANTLFLWTENAQYELYGEPVLTPKTVRLDVVSRYHNTPTVRPIVVGPRLYFAHKQSGSALLYEWQNPSVEDSTRYLARDITTDVPTYLPGQILDIAGDYGQGAIAVIVDGDQDSIFVWSFTPKGDGSNIHEGWQRWTLPTGVTARQLDFADGKLALLYSYSDGIFLDEADLDQPITGGTQGFLDRRESNTSTVYNGAGPDTTDISFSHDVATNGSEGTIAVWDKDSGVQATVVSRPDTLSVEVEGNWTAVNFDIGIAFTATARLAPLYLRTEAGQAETGGRTQVRYLEVFFNHTEALDIEVTPQGRAKYKKSITETTPTDGAQRVSVLARGEDTLIELVSATPGDARVNSLDFEFQHTSRSRRA